MGEQEFIGERESTERESTERCKWRSLPRVHSTASVPDTVPEAEREYTTKLLTSFPEAPASLLFFFGGGRALWVQGAIRTRRIPKDLLVQTSGPKGPRVQKCSKLPFGTRGATYNKNSAGLSGNSIGFSKYRALVNNICLRTPVFRVCSSRWPGHSSLTLVVAPSLWFPGASVRHGWRIDARPGIYQLYKQTVY